MLSNPRRGSRAREQIVERLLLGFLEVLLARFRGALEVPGTPPEQLESLIRVSMEVFAGLCGCGDFVPE